MKMLQLTCALAVVGLVAAVGCGSDDDDGGGSGGGGNTTSGGGSGGSTGGSGGTAGGSGGSTGGVSGGGGTAGAAGGTSCPTTAEGCHTCGQLPGQAHSANCTVGPADLCGFVPPPDPSSKSAEKFFTMIECACNPANNCFVDNGDAGFGGPCAALCGAKEPPTPECLTCFQTACAAENTACNDDDGS